ncbi:hypothetical protein CERZMDRAFT_81321 [Cercospora zeae-maydis SCOH1-5]|uniref:DUF7053 domain-containing protein n=1 Tax=Cercospora zeae-maydis SCOH1-5 TaxID=717836 RepID=A0A6A6FRU0_9PEZI|nr:hypothetical protein CERZMDRAFT_81321 [Cercospora zeae-maydis SCOH1-5]
MFETSFQHASSTPLPKDVSLDNGLQLLHDFETVIRLSPDCRGCKPIPPPKTGQQKRQANREGKSQEQEDVLYYEVEDDLPFIPKTLWSGGVKYQADFLPQPDGCDITVHAPGGFTSTNRWRLLRENEPPGRPSELDHEKDLAQARSKNTLHADQTSSGWYVQIVSDAKVNRTFASFVKGFLKSSHQQLQNAFIEKLKGPDEQEDNNERPKLGRRTSSHL